MARGDDVIVVHRGQTEPDKPDGCTHLHTDRAEFGQVAERVRALRPDAVIDTLAMTKADADAVLPHLPDTILVLLSSVDVYRAYELLLAKQRNGPTGTIKLTFLGQYTKFENFASEQYVA